jgi:hypothetical protein
MSYLISRIQPDIKQAVYYQQNFANDERNHGRKIHFAPVCGMKLSVKLSVIVMKSSKK